MNKFRAIMKNSKNTTKKSFFSVIFVYFLFGFAEEEEKNNGK